MPPANTRTESARINLRTSPEAKALIERAAAIMGSTVSGFMLQNAYEAARKVVAGQDIITPVSYTHLDVYKRQGVAARWVNSRGVSASACCWHARWRCRRKCC